MTRLIVSDIDGTLVNEARVMTKYTRFILNEVHQKGILFGVASGRPCDDLKYFADIWGLNFPFDMVIGMNGSQLYDGHSGKYYSFYKLKKEWIKEIVDFMSIYDLNPFIYKDDYMLALKMDEEMASSSKRNGKEVKIASDISELYAEDNAKILYRIPLELIDEVEDYANKHIKGEYKTFKTQPTMLEFAHKKTDKANALIKFCKLHKIPLSEVVSFGDASNDDGIIKVSGTGVCMKNAIQSTKDIADIILDKTNNEDGVADYITKNIL